MMAGWLTRLSTPPSDSARVKTLTLSSTRLVRSRSPSISTVTIPPKPFIWREASSCCGWEIRPG